MQREQSRDDPHRLALAELGCAISSSRSSLCGVEAVAGLDLDRRAAAAPSARGGGARLCSSSSSSRRRRGALRRSRRCRRRPWRSPRSSRRRGASHARRRGCRRTRDGCGSRSGPASPRRRRARRRPSRGSRRARCACRRARSCRRRSPIAPFSIRPSGLPGAASSVAMLQSTSSRSHMSRRLRRARLLASKRWRAGPTFPTCVDRDAGAPVGLVGAPLAAGSVTPGRCDLAPGLLRADAAADRPLRRRDRPRARDRRSLDRGDVATRRPDIEQATPLDPRRGRGERRRRMR